MLKDCQNNKFELEILRIVDGVMQCDRINARQCYLERAQQLHTEYSDALEMWDKVAPKSLKADPWFIECCEELREKVSIYERFFAWYDALEQAA